MTEQLAAAALGAQTPTVLQVTLGNLISDLFLIHKVTFQLTENHQECAREKKDVASALKNHQECALSLLNPFDSQPEFYFHLLVTSFQEYGSLSCL